jgi:hypothetical protein
MRRRPARRGDNFNDGRGEVIGIDLDARRVTVNTVGQHNQIAYDNLASPPARANPDSRRVCVRARLRTFPTGMGFSAPTITRRECVSGSPERLSGSINRIIASLLC